MALHVFFGMNGAAPLMIPSRRSRSSGGSLDPLVERFREHRGDNTRELSRALEGADAIARVVSVHDGDTLTAVFEALGGFYKIHVRIDGIDAPELRAVSPANRKVAGLARDRMVDLIVDDPDRTGHLATARDATCLGAYDPKQIDALFAAGVYVVRIQCGRCEKYGRLLGKVSSAYSDALSPSFGDALIEARLALPYGGGHKMTEADQMRALGRDVDTGELLRAPAAEGFWRKGVGYYFTGWLPWPRALQTVHAVQAVQTVGEAVGEAVESVEAVEETRV